jgi:hypothetical protein
MGYCSRRPHRVPLLSSKNKKKQLQWARDHQHWTIEECKNITWLEEIPVPVDLCQWQNQDLA